MQRTPGLFALVFFAASLASGQTTPPSSSSSGTDARPQPPSSSRPRAGQAEAAGAAITLEISESLFTLAAGLNACGYDDDLARSNPVRAAVRADIQTALEASAPARTARDGLCQYVREHELNDKGRELAQYISLALYLGPPPALLPTADQTDMPPDALQVVNILPLLRTFASAVGLHAIWQKHRPAYDVLADRIHDPLTAMILSTNIYLRVPVSSYDGRRFLVLVEPMLAPSAPNARIYTNDYLVVTSPDAAGVIRMDQVRHLYLHYSIEPLVYARASSMTRLMPLLKPVQAAPLEYVYKSDIIALLTECLIKAVEARTLDVGIPRPQKPVGSRVRADLARYDEDSAAYERRAEVVRRRAVDLNMRQGWVLTQYFYDQMLLHERNPDGLKEEMGEMVYGMDVGREQHRDEQISFLPEGSSEFVRRVRPAPTGIALAEKKMLEGDLPAARDLASKALADPHLDHAEATFVLARLDLMQGDPQASLDHFDEVLKSSKNPRTLAWAHIYRGRLLDNASPPEREDAIAEYKAAIATPGIQADALAAATAGVKSPFAPPSRSAPAPH